MGRKTKYSFKSDLDDFAIWLDVQSKFVFPDYVLPALRSAAQKRWDLKRRR